MQWSDELHRIHGVDPLEFAGTLDAHLGCAHPDDRARIRDAMEAAVRSAQPFEDEYRIVRPDGEERWIYLRAEPTLGSAGVVVGLRGIGQDVTDGADHSRPTRFLTRSTRSCVVIDAGQAVALGVGPIEQEASSRRVCAAWERRLRSEVVELLGLTDGLDGIDDVVEVLAAGRAPRT